MTYQVIKDEISICINQFFQKVELKKGNLFVVGCSTSEVCGHLIGKNSNEEIARAIFDGISEILRPKGVFFAAQCCEHLNRAIIIEKDALRYDSVMVNVVPQLKAGGAFAKTVYENFSSPVAVEYIKCDAGLDIGNTFIGMHLKEVAVPIRIDKKSVGNANISFAATRLKYVGGERAVYDNSLTTIKMK